MRVASLVGQRLAWYRSHAGDGSARRLTVQEVAGRCAKLGLPLGRVTLSKLERGHRESVQLAEILVIAAALEVAPVDLMAGLGREAVTEILPGVSVTTWDAVRWITGTASLEPAGDGAVLHARAGGPGELFAWHDATLARALRDPLPGRDQARQELAMIREVMRDRGLEPLPLPPHLAHLDGAGEPGG